MSALLEQPYPLIVITFLFLGLLTAVSNSRATRTLDDYPAPPHFPPVSILVPARDEADNIEACVQSLLDQDYPEFEVIVLDDHSSDETWSLLVKLAGQNDRLRVLEGKPLPFGWLGKQWACHQMAEVAEGELFLFTDADTQHRSNMLRDSVSTLVAGETHLLTAFPYEEAVSWGEKLVVPIISWGIFSFLPIRLARWLSWPDLSVTIGQFMLFRRTSFEAIGGYASVREHIVDDVKLGRMIRSHGYRWDLFDGTAHVSCRMYHGFWEAVEGFSKNVFVFFEYRILFYLAAWLWVVFAFLEPPLALVSRYIGFPLTDFPPNLAVVAVIQSLMLFRIAYRRFRLPWYLTFLYPVSLFLFFLVAMRSMVMTMRGRITWKGRSIIRPTSCLF